jgi:hypothetical protein
MAIAAGKRERLMNEALLAGLPDPATLTPDALVAWCDAQAAAMAALTFAAGDEDRFRPVELDPLPPHALGLEAHATARRFFLGVLLADWASYAGVDRIDAPRLKFILDSAYRCFRLWLFQGPDGVYRPVGYTAWYPMAGFVFESLMNGGGGTIDDRGLFLPLRRAELDRVRYAYVLNISLVASLRNTSCSRRMVRAFRADGLKYGHEAGLMAVTVDEAGRRFSTLTGMRYVGDICVQGSTEALYVRPPARRETPLGKKG